MAKNIRALLSKKLIWVENKHNPVLFNLRDGVIEASIRMNDFPDEIMYTIILGDEMMDMDDLPDNWELIYNE